MTNLYRDKGRARTLEDTRDATEEAIDLVGALSAIFAYGEEVGQLDSASCTGGGAVVRALHHHLCRILADLHAAAVAGHGASGAAALPAEPVTERSPADIEEDAKHVAGLLRVLRDALRTGERNGNGLDMEATEGAIDIVNDALDTAARLRGDVVDLRAHATAGGAL
ncbi:hypothetical protein ACQVP2_28205 [Methylobacterium aquaticum]|uniref:hypothetical protein n=1 Tax=Methylobacterium aquaticum TaxID=270351 RepID=UPI003D16841A